MLFLINTVSLFTVLLCTVQAGTTYTVYRNSTLLAGQGVVSERTWFVYMRRIMPAIKRLADETVQRAIEAAIAAHPEGLILCMDGGWSSRYFFMLLCTLLIYRYYFLQKASKGVFCVLRG